MQRPCKANNLLKKENRNLDSHKTIPDKPTKSMLPTAVIEMTIPFNH